MLAVFEEGARWIAVSRVMGDDLFFSVCLATCVKNLGKKINLSPLLNIFRFSC